MKKTLFLSLVTIACFVSITTLALAEAGYISTTENITKELEPEIAEITISVENTDKVSEKAVEANKKDATNIYAAVKALLENGDYIKTGEYTLAPKYTYKDNKKELDCYTVTNSIIVRTKNLKAVSTIIDTAVSKGANKISDLKFITEDYNSACNDALAELSARAKEKASIVAKALNSQISGIKYIDTSCSTENSRPYYMLSKSSLDTATNARGTSTPIEAGKVKIFAQVNADFYIK